ncbi:contactin-associated protein-like 5 [Oculina patagonica]
MIRYTAIFQVKLTLLFVISKTQSVESAETCKFPPLIRFSKLVPDHVLEGRVISSVHVASDQECQMKCILSRLCDSFNLGPQTSSKHYPCEVLDRRFSRKKTKRKGWKFRAGKCQTSPCLNGGTCYTLNNDEPLCACAGTWKGDTCNRLTATCSDWKALNSSAPSGFNVISPGYQAGVTPFTVYCNMTYKNGVGVTVISHDSEDRTSVKGCDPHGCYSRDINYQGASLLQLENLVAVSGHCEQFIKYECLGSSLTRGWWVSRDGIRMSYWGGGSGSGSSQCACGMTNSCDVLGYGCNCNINDDVIREDSGYLTDKSSLPVSQLRFGDAGGPGEQGWHTLGKLYCYGFPV